MMKQESAVVCKDNCIRIIAERFPCGLVLVYVFDPLMPNPKSIAQFYVMRTQRLCAQ